MPHAWSCTPDTWKASFVRNGRRIQFIRAKLKPIKCAGNMHYEFIVFSFDSNHKIVSCNRSLALN